MRRQKNYRTQKSYLNEFIRASENERYAKEFINREYYQETQFIIANGHGVTTNKEFVLPKGTNVIFITEIGKSLIAGDDIYKPVIDTYLRGNTLFNNYDYSTDESPSGLKIEKLLKNLIKNDLNNPHRSYEINNIIGDGKKKILDHKIFFSGSGCNNYRYSCKVMKGIIGKPQSGIIINPKNMGYSRNRRHINRPGNRLKLRNILNDEYNITLSNLIKKFGKGSYIILGCRDFSKKIPLENLKRIGPSIRKQKLQKINNNKTKRRENLKRESISNSKTIYIPPHKRRITTGGNKKKNRKKKYIKIKNYGKRLIRYTKTNKKYIILNGKKKYIK